MRIQWTPPPVPAELSAGTVDAHERALLSLEKALDAPDAGARTEARAGLADALMQTERLMESLQAEIGRAAKAGNAARVRELSDARTKLFALWRRVRARLGLPTVTPRPVSESMRKPVRNIPRAILAFTAVFVLALVGFGLTRRSEVVLPIVRKGNRPPEITSLKLEVGHAYARALVDGKDPDGEDVSLGFEWFVDGRATGVTFPDFPVSRVGKGQILEVAVVLSDAGGLKSAPARARAKISH